MQAGRRKLRGPRRPGAGKTPPLSHKRSRSRRRMEEGGRAMFAECDVMTDG
jgi:hypothetical protein